ncbi:MAG: DUF3604 domain-containing protein [Pseudomonadales bacterium]
MKYLLVLVLLTISLAPALGAELPATLREAVRQLQAEANTSPTDETSRAARAETVWQWANGLSLAGVQLPVHATQIATQALHARGKRLAIDHMLDNLIVELSLMDDTPTALGTLTATQGPFTARTHAEIRQTYTVGTREIPTGGGFVIAAHFMSNAADWQITDSAGDNYLSITSSNPAVNFAADSVPFPGMHGGFRGTAKRIVFRVASGSLNAGDTVTITYGDRSGGGRGLLLPSFSTDAWPLPVYVTFSPGDQFFSLPIQPIRIVGAELTGVAAFGPSIVGVNEPFTLSVRGEDAFANRAAGDMPGWRVYANDTLLAEVPPGGDAVTLVDNLKLASPGAWHIRVESMDGNVRGEGNPILVQTAPVDRIFWGDTHGHSGFAEGIGTPEGFMTWARDDARLDYVTHSEHDVFMDDAEWETLRRTVITYSEPGRFVPFLGYEWTVENRLGGHHNVLFRTPEDRARLGSQQFPTLSRLYAGIHAAVAEKDVLLIPHAHQSGDYRLVDPELTRLVEIMSMHGNFEWFGRMYLNHGNQVGFVAASDNHLAKPGYSAPIGGSLSQRGGLGAVLASERTTDGIFDAMRGLRTYATTGDRIILSFTANGTPMGQRAPMDRNRKLQGQVIGTAPLDNIAIFKNDQLLWTQSYALEDRHKGEPLELAVSFDSSAEPVNPGDNPRGWRPWSGLLKVVGARVLAARPARQQSLTLSRISADANAPDTWRFATLSRGAPSTLLLTLDDVRANASLSIQLDEGMEFGGAPPIYRQHQPVDAASVTIRLADLRDGRQTARMPAVDYQDEITVRRLRPGGTREASFDVDDTGTTQGDYYTVRVMQNNDAIAWSSPIWIGGHPPR